MYISIEIFKLLFFILDKFYNFFVFLFLLLFK